MVQFVGDADSIRGDGEEGELFVVFGKLKWEICESKSDGKRSYDTYLNFVYVEGAL